MTEDRKGQLIVCVLCVNILYVYIYECVPVKDVCKHLSVCKQPQRDTK